MNWFQSIYQSIKNTMDKARPPFPSIPTLLLICEASKRSGISASSLASNVIRRMVEIGIPTGANPDGSPNLINAFIRVFSEEIVKEFKDNAQIECASQSGTNILPFSIKGILK